MIGTTVMKDLKQHRKTSSGFENGIYHAGTYAYFYWHTYDFGHAYVDTYAHFLPMIFENFSSSDSFILFKNLLLYISPLINLFVLARHRFFTVFIFLKKPYFSIFHKNYLINISRYLGALANLSVNKKIS